MKHALSLILVALLTLAFTGCSDGKNAAKTGTKKVPPLKIEAVTVTKKKFPIWIELTGMTKASSAQDVQARVSGRLEARYFEDGQVVKKGEKLFKIEQDTYLADLNAAKANRARDEASLKLATANVNRYAPLVKDGLAPRATLDEYVAQQSQYEASILADEAHIKAAEINLDYTIIRAPISGKISARRVDVGNLVGYEGPTKLTTIVKIDPLYVYFSPSEAESQKIAHYASKSRLDAFITVPTSDTMLERQRLNGYVDFTNNAVDPATSTITMRATLDNKEGSVVPGTFVYVHVFVTDQYAFYMIPSQAISEDQLGRYVYVVDAQNRAKKIYVKVGLGSRLYVNITKGLANGDRVIISGLVKIKEGTEVDPTDVTDTKGVMAMMRTNGLIPQAK